MGKKIEAAKKAKESMVKVGDILLDMEVIAKGKQGDGICKTSEGMVVILPGAQVGDRHDVEIVKVVEKDGHLSFAFGKDAPRR